MKTLAIVATVLSALLAAVLLLFVIPFPVHAQVPSRTVTWTAPGDDGNVGTATFYTLKWSLNKPDTTSSSAMVDWWAAATNLTGLPVPAVAGTFQSYSGGPVGGWTTGKNYYLVIRATDDAGNIAEWSNVAIVNIPDTAPPSPIIDLRVSP